jgi:DNA invertase Pin-like site-specific DNA recombinase
LVVNEAVSSIGQRDQLERVLEYVRSGDTLVVTKVDRLARSTVGLWELVKRLEAIDDGGAGLRILNLGGETVDTKSATGKLILTIFAGFAQSEREMMLERQREGIAKAKAENRYLGRKPSARLKADEAVKLFKGGRTVTDIAVALSIGRGSVYRALEAAGIRPPQIATVLTSFNRDRGEPRGSSPPTPPGVRVRTTAVRRIKRSRACSWRASPDDGSALW